MANQRATLIAEFRGDTSHFETAAKKVARVGADAGKALEMQRKVDDARLKVQQLILSGKEKEAKLLQDHLAKAEKILAAQREVAQLAQKMRAQYNISPAAAQQRAEQALTIERRVNQVEAARAQARRQPLPLPSRPNAQINRAGAPGGGPGGGASGGNKGHDLNRAYHIGQDLLQGGIGAVANQATDIKDLFMEHVWPKLKPMLPALLRATAITAAALPWIKAGYDFYQISETEDNAFDTYRKNRNKQRPKLVKQEQERRAKRLLRAGEQKAATARSAAEQGTEQMASLDDQEQAAQAALDQQMRMEQARAAGITDEMQRVEAIAALEMKHLEERNKLEKKYAQERLAEASQNFNYAQGKFNETAQKLTPFKDDRILSPNQRGEKAGLLAAKEGQREALERASQDVRAAGEAMDAANRGEQALRGERAIIQQGVANEKKAAADQRAAEAARKAAQDAAQLAENKREADRKAADASRQFASNTLAANAALKDYIKGLQDTKAAQGKSDRSLELLEAEASGMSPRKLKKVQRAARLRDVEDDLRPLWGDEAPARARRMVNAEEDAEARRSGKRRIRGAGYRRKDDPKPEPFGLDNPGFRLLGNETFDRIDNPKFNLLQSLKGPEEKRTIKGAGYKGGAVKPSRDREEEKREDSKNLAVSAATAAGGPVLGALVSIATDIKEVRNLIGVRAINNKN